MSSIKYLVLSGGGVKGIAMLGALKKLFDKKMLDMGKIRCVIGTSVGAIIGTFLILGYTPEEMFDEVMNLDLEGMFDPDISNFMYYYGLDSGHKFVNYFKKLFERKNFSGSITFRKLYSLTRKRLVLTGTNVNKQKVVYFDHRNTPNLKVVDAIRTSMSIPLAFTSPIYMGEYYVDGGVLDNFPIHILHNASPQEVLAIKFKKTHDKHFSSSGENGDSNKINSPIHFYLSLIECLLGEIEYLKANLSSSLYKKSTIFIDTRDITSIHIDIDSDVKKNLYLDWGPKSVDEYLKSISYISLRYETLPEKIKSKILQYCDNG